MLLLTFIKYKLDLTKFLILAISPLGIYSFIIYDTIYHRKEIFILNLLLIYVLINEQKKSFLFNSVYIYFFTLISLLVHEGVSLILLPFLFYIYKNEILYYRMPVKLLYYYFLFALVIVLLIIVNSGNMNTALEVWYEIPVSDRNIINNNHPPDSEYGEMNAIDSFQGL